MHETGTATRLNSETVDLDVPVTEGSVFRLELELIVRYTAGLLALSDVALPSGSSQTTLGTVRTSS